MKTIYVKAGDRIEFNGESVTATITGLIEVPDNMLQFTDNGVQITMFVR